MKNLTKINHSLDTINEMAINNLTTLVYESESIYKKQIDDLVKELTQKNKNYKVILMSGPSSAGKTTTSNFIKKKLESQNYHCIVISLDDFFINRENTPRLADGSYDFESIYALDLEYFNLFLDELLTKHKSKMPMFDFLTGQRKDEFVDVEISDHTYVIFEGIHALNPLLIGNNHIDEIFKVYICLNTNFVKNKKIVIPPKELRLMRRLLRDYSTRGHSISATLSMWNNVLIGEEKYIKPFKNTADFIVDSTHLYEPLLYATYLSPLLEKAEEVDKVKSFQKIFSECVKLTKECVPSGSLLWEFLVS